MSVKPGQAHSLPTPQDHPDRPPVYNHRRPHRSLPRRATPATLNDSMPKALPGPDHRPVTHDRIRHDRVDKAGSVTLRHNSRLHHIGIG